jgi:hypothetical protein
MFLQAAMARKDEKFETSIRSFKHSVTGAIRAHPALEEIARLRIRTFRAGRSP